MQALPCKAAQLEVELYDLLAGTWKLRAPDSWLRTMQDVYSEVAGLVREQVAADAARGVHWAPLLLPEIDRKLVKQTVMTSVYGVTFVGARSQITNRLKERRFNEHRPDTAYHIAFYAAQVRRGCTESPRPCRPVQCIWPSPAPTLGPQEAVALACCLTLSLEW